MYSSAAKKPRKVVKKPRVARKKSPDSVKSRSDDRGNLLIIKNNGKRILLSLKLVSEGGRFRKIGVVNLGQATLEIKRQRKKHLFRKGNAYGFNHKLLEDSKLFDKIRLQDEHDEWVIPKSHILEHGSFLHFLNEGFEKQIFTSLESIEQFKRHVRI